MTSLIRIESKGHPSFITTKTNKNIAYFKNTVSVETVISSIYVCREENWMSLLSFVVMPNHLHIIFMPRDKNPSQIMHSIKSYTAIKINKQLERRGNLWQHGFWEYKIPSIEILLQKIQYIHNNPVRKNLSTSPEEYPFSTANSKYKTDLEMFV
jgi:REP element-mobilizing transposase RayT